MSETTVKTREIELTEARTIYTKRHRFVYGLRMTLSVKDAHLVELKSRYELARSLYLNALASVHGPERARIAENQERWALHLAKLEKWEKIVSIVVGGAATGVTIGMVGAGTLAAGVLGSLFGRMVVIPLAGMIPGTRYIFGNFETDSTKTISLRAELAGMWEKEKEESGMTYEIFCKRHRARMQKLSRNVLTDKALRAGTVGAFGFAAFGVTGGRNIVSSYLASIFGEKIMFGERLIQRITIGAFGALADLFTPSGASAAEIPSDSVVKERARGFHYPDERVTEAQLDALEAALPRYIAWAEIVLEEYKRTLDMRDSACVRMVQSMERSIGNLRALIADLQSHKPGSIRFIENLPGDPADTSTPHGRNVRLLYQKTKLFSLRGSIENLLAGARMIEKIENGQVWITGVVQDIRSFFRSIGVEFKYPDHWELKPRTARMFMEVYRDISDDPRLRSAGLRITEGGDGETLTNGHSRTSGHKTGDAFDMTPLGGAKGGFFTKEYVATMFAKMYENSLIAARDPRIIEYFENKIRESSASGDTAMHDYYQKRLAWAQSPYSTQYYTFYYEPSTNGPVGAKGEVVKVMMEEFGMTRPQAEAYYEKHSGNTANTTNAHFHIWPPEDIRKGPKQVFASTPLSGTAKTASIED